MNIEKKYNYLYSITSKFNGKFYIGMHSTDNLEDGYFGSGRKLLSEIKKYGKDRYDLEILEFFNSREELIEKEKEVVNNELVNNWFCLNLIEGGVDYKKGDKIYNNYFDKEKWQQTKFVSITKNSEIRNVITNLLPYYKSIGWEMCIDDK
jgi:hypothetical protein